MRAVDTNVLVRLLARDDAEQVADAEAFVEPIAWVPTLAVAEAIWVLGLVYELPSAKLVLGLEMLLAHRNLVLQDAEAVSAALAQFRLRPSLGFSDCLMLEIARKAGHLPMGTFDRKLGTLEGAQQITKSDPISGERKARKARAGKLT